MTELNISMSLRRLPKSRTGVTKVGTGSSDAAEDLDHAVHKLQQEVLHTALSVHPASGRDVTRYPVGLSVLPAPACCKA